MRFHCNGLFGMVLADIFVHLINAQWLVIFIITNHPQTRRLIIFIIGDVKIIGSCAYNLITSVRIICYFSCIFFNWLCCGCRLWNRIEMISNCYFFFICFLHICESYGVNCIEHAAFFKIFHVSCFFIIIFAPSTNTIHFVFHITSKLIIILITI